MFYFEVTDIKTFMSLLLKKDIFDYFYVRSVYIDTYNRFEINAAMNSSYVSDAAPFSYWKDIRPIVFLIIKGKRLPQKMKIVLSLSEKETASISEDASAMFLNINYDNGNLFCTTGSSQKNFILDNKVDYLCEEYFKNFFNDKKII